MATPPPRRTFRDIPVGLIILIAGIVFVLAAAFDLLKPNSDVNFFELGVGLSFLGLAIG